MEAEAEAIFNSDIKLEAEAEAVLFVFNENGSRSGFHYQSESDGRSGKRMWRFAASKTRANMAQMSICQSTSLYGL